MAELNGWTARLLGGEPVAALKFSELISSAAATVGEGELTAPMLGVVRPWSPSGGRGSGGGGGLSGAVQVDNCKNRVESAYGLRA